MIDAEGSELLAEVFNRMTLEQKNSVPAEIAERIGRFMVENGYRIVFARWYLQERPEAEKWHGTTFSDWWATLTDRRQARMVKEYVAEAWNVATVAEREACAKVAESYRMIGAGTIATAIRERSKKNLEKWK